MSHLERFCEKSNGAQIIIVPTRILQMNGAYEFEDNENFSSNSNTNRMLDNNFENFPRKIIEALLKNLGQFRHVFRKV